MAVVTKWISVAFLLILPFFCLCFSCIKSLPRRRSVGLCWTQLYAGWPPRMSCSYNRKKDQNRTLKKKRKRHCCLFSYEMCIFCCWCYSTTLLSPKTANIFFCALHTNSNYRNSHILCTSSLFFTYLFMAYIFYIIVRL